MDVLSDVLDTMRLRGTLYFSIELNKPWGVRVPSFRRVARFHLVVRGGVWVRVEHESAPIHLEAGDLILVPHGAMHVLCDAEDSPVQSVDEVVTRAGFTGTGTLVHGGADTGVSPSHYRRATQMEHAAEHARAQSS